MNIYEKLLEIQKSVDYLQKDNNGKQYDYVSSSQVLAQITKLMNKQGLLLVPEIQKHEVTTNTTKTGTLSYFTEIDVDFTWINVEKPSETYRVKFYGQGVDLAGEKGVGKALTYAEKYFFLKFFHIPTDKDDPDSFQEKNKPAMKFISAEIVKELKAELATIATEAEQLTGTSKATIYKEFCQKSKITPDRTDERGAAIIRKYANDYIEKARREYAPKTRQPELAEAGL